MTREGIDLVTISCIDIVFFNAFRPFANKRKNVFFSFFHKKEFSHYTCIDYLAMGERVWKKRYAGNTPRKFALLYQKGNNFLRMTRRETRKWKERLQKGDIGEVKKALDVFYKRFYIVNTDFSILPWLALEAWQRRWQDVCVQIAERNNVGNPDSFFSSFLIPWKKTAIIKIEDEIRKGVDPSVIARKYQFLRSWAVVWHRPINRQWILQFRDSSSQKKSGSSFSQRKLDRALASLHLTKSEETYMKAAPFILFFKDWRDDVRREFVFRWHFLFEFIADLMHVPERDIGYLSFSEIYPSLIGRKKWKDIIQRRKENAVVVAEAEDGVRLLEGRIPDTFITAMQDSELRFEGEQHISGVGVSPGNIRGRVCIVCTYHDLKRVSDKSILVANTTHPNFLPAMKRARAFVTNEGDFCRTPLLSHEN